MNNVFIYLYCLIPSSEIYDGCPMPSSIDEKRPCCLKRFGNLTAVVSEVDASEFSQQVLEERVQDPEWLKVNGTQHHACISYFCEKHTVLPVSFCTIFTSESSLEERLRHERQHVLSLFESIYDKQEWNLKVYIDRQRIEAYVAENSQELLDAKESIRKASQGRQFFLKKKLSQTIDNEVQKQISIEWDCLLTVVAKNTSVDYKIKNNWPKELTGDVDEMVVNSVLLIPTSDVEGVLRTLESHQQKTKDMGIRFDISGPWPPYHFASFAKEA